MQIIRWHGPTVPHEAELRQVMRQDGLSPYSWSNAPGDHYAAHTHNYEKILYCVKGSIRFTLPDYPDTAGEANVIDLSPGDCMILPADICHSAQVGPHGVTCLEAARYNGSRTRTA